MRDGRVKMSLRAKYQIVIFLAGLRVNLDLIIEKHKKRIADG